MVFCLHQGLSAAADGSDVEGPVDSCRKKIAAALQPMQLIVSRPPHAQLRLAHVHSLHGAYNLSARCSMAIRDPRSLGEIALDAP